MESNPNSKLVRDEIESMINSMLQFWYQGNDDIRCPFPLEIQGSLIEMSCQKALMWYDKLSPEEHNKLKLDQVVEHFENLIFEEALNLVSHEDDKITIQYPFMPRIGDQIKHEDKPESMVVKREIVCIKEVMYLQVDFQNRTNKEKWTTRFELHP